MEAGSGIPCIFRCVPEQKIHLKKKPGFYHITKEQDPWHQLTNQETHIELDWPITLRRKPTTLSEFNRAIFKTLGYSGLAYTTAEEFKNSDFTLGKRIICLPSTLFHQGNHIIF